ncbi:hypothetical protein CJP72_15440 [Citrobacter sp. NCU1]|uniref:hypothetical protein n=1 Tax=Citrobacter sp. NCU1 TaxID=2026683 RepID=UPI001390C168|nr:hypothetical protein [Citrobacter sp. NCU1]NDO82106.1 hypothetical protein [Citrobacter sp. NCU1]
MINPNVNTVTPSPYGMSTKHTVTPPSPINGGIDESRWEVSVSEAQTFNKTFQPEMSEIPEHLTSYEKKVFIEQKYRPLLITAIGAHRDACDTVSHFEDNSDVYKINERVRYAMTLKHPEVKTVLCRGVEHFKHLSMSGDLNILGYRLVDTRITGDSQTLVFIPNDKQSLQSFSETQEAHVYADHVYELELKRLLSKRNRAAIELQGLRDHVNDIWSSVDDFESLFSSSVRKGRK